MTYISKSVLPALFLVVASAMQGAEVGDRYEKVLKDHGDPVGQVVMGNRRVLSYADVSIRLKDDVVVAVTKVSDAPISVVKAPPPKPVAPVAADKDAAANASPNREAALRTKAIAEARVKEIVNQPVASVPIARHMRVSNSPDGWFHEGASKPDFERVDVRTSQEFPYATRQFMTSPLNPGVAFPAGELEFNANLKFFYTDRTVPKKKLNEAEMAEINTLYRTIAKTEKELQAFAKAAVSGK